MFRSVLLGAGSVALHAVLWLALPELPATQPAHSTLAMTLLPAPPPAPAPAATPAPAAAPAAKPARTKRFVASVKKTAPPAAAVDTAPAAGPEAAPAATGSETGSESGSAGGEAVGAGPPSGTEGAAPGPAPVVYDPLQRARPVEDYTRLVPEYSDEAIDSDVNGAVSLRLEIDEDGRVTRASVLRGLGHGLDQIAVATALRYRFAPARGADGRPVRTVIGWNVVWESYWKRLVVQTVAGHPNCRGHGPMNLGETHPEYIDCDHPPGAFTLAPADAARP